MACGAFDAHRRFRELTVHILGDTLLGVDTAGDESVVMAAADAVVDRSDPRRLGQLLPDVIPTPTDRRLARRLRELDAYVDALLEDASADGNDVRSVLVGAHEEAGLTRAEVRDNLVAVLLAGHDSSAAALTYLWYELTRHPSVLGRIREEVTEVVGDRLPAGGDVADLQVTHAVVKETLRLYPSAWATPRTATEPVVLGGYHIPEGAQVLAPQWALHRDERFWDDPEAFDPDRWVVDAERPEYAYFPFSGGPRHCLGMRFATHELVLVTAALADRFDLAVEADGPLSYRLAVTLRPTVDMVGTVRPR
ncbi:MAG: cytochrome P450 [Halobacteriales archaeon]